MVEVAVKANASEAYQLFQRGMAAARGGQRRVAAGLLTRSVRLDPNNEQAWLWLSGVLDDPEQIAFCLRAALRINPSNARAQQGLRWLEERKLLHADSANGASNGNGNGNGSARALGLTLPELASQPAAQPATADTAHAGWWVQARQSWRETSRLRLVLWSVPIILLCLALVVHQAFALAMQPGPDVPRLAAQAASAVTTAATAAVDRLPGEATVAPVVAILEEEPASVRASLTIGYLSVLEALRTDLRNAVDSYRNATGQPGGASIGHVAAARELRARVEQAHTTMQGLRPPTDLQAAHDEYLQGLALELQAIDDLLEFYGSYRVELANRAALRFQEANAHFARARTVFDAHAAHVGLTSQVSPHTAR